VTMKVALTSNRLQNKYIQQLRHGFIMHARTELNYTKLELKITGTAFLR